MNKDVLLHGAKVFAFVAVSGAVANLLAFLTSVHPATALGVAVLGLVNAVLAMALKYVQSRNV